MDRCDVFLSHNSADKPAVEALARRLLEAGLEPWLDKWNLIPGEPWQEGLEEALDNCQTVAVFLGPGEISPWENEEMRSALDERVRDKRRRVIPVLLPGAPDPSLQPLPRFLSRLTWVDFRNGLDDEVAFHRLVAGIRGVAPGSGPDVSSVSPITPGVPPQSELVSRPGSELESLQRLLVRRQHNLNKLRESAAIYAAGEVPLYMLNQIEEEEMEVQRIKERLKALEG